MIGRTERRPLRRVIIHEAHGLHVLECGHRREFRFTAYGPTFPAKARCLWCATGAPRHFTREQMVAFEAQARGDRSEPEPNRRTA